ncbi:transcriptional repressor [Rhodobacterales bacterium HKCCE3408]|nr:transcriptional repressor [Rhodobacterales bacterium HKCCE3408]
MSASGFDRHDHASCIADAMAAAEARAAAEGLRLTPVRKRVLAMLLEEHRALGAYDVLDRLRAEGHSAQPPVAYRALDFLVGHGFAHRVERLNAFVACTGDHGETAPIFMICRGCEMVAEIDSDRAARPLAEAARAAGFAVERQVIEAEGLCPACAGETP